MEPALRRILDDGIEKVLPGLGADEASGISRSLARLYDEITLFNPAYGLVNADGRELVVRHILDCLAPAWMMGDATKGMAHVDAADLGSGAGLPGLVLAAVFPSWNLSLVERMGRRAGFLRNTVAAMGLSKNVQVVQKDLSEVHDTYNIVTFRAFRQFKDIACDLGRIVAPDGRVFAYKSSDGNVEDELKVLEEVIPGVFESKAVSYEAPFSEARRQMLILHRKVV